MIPSSRPDPRDEDACRAAAGRLQDEHPNWLVIWGCYTRRFVAFPLFAAPRGTILSAAAPDELAARMRRQERSARVRVPRPSPPPDQAEAADPRDAPGRL